MKKLLTKYAEVYRQRQQQRDLNERRRFPLEKRLKENIVGQVEKMSIIIILWVRFSLRFIKTKRGLSPSVQVVFSDNKEKISFLKCTKLFSSVVNSKLCRRRKETASNCFFAEVIEIGNFNESFNFRTGPSRSSRRPFAGRRTDGSTTSIRSSSSFSGLPESGRRSWPSRSPTTSTRATRRGSSGWT